MNHRQRIQTALRFEGPDRLPVHESPWTQTIELWHQQGLPRDVSLADFFDFDLCMMYLDPSPRFDMEILERRDGQITYRDRFGYTITKADGIESTCHFQDHATKDQQAWEQIKPRFQLSQDISEPARIDDESYFAHFDAYPSWDEAVGKYQRLRATNRYLLFVCYGPWEATWRHRGYENLLMDVALDPDWVTDMAACYQSLVIDTLRKCIESGMKPDGVITCDDLGSSHGPLISPRMWCDIFQAEVARLGSFLHQHDVDFWLHTDGAVKPLIDHFVEAGVKVLNPLEAKAGMDVVDLRKRFGTKLAFYGNIDITKMSGSQEAIYAELQHKVPVARQGGFLFHSDHSCPPQVSFERYCWILKTARAIFLES